MNQVSCAILLCGFIRGLLSRTGDKLEKYPEMVSALKTLGVPEKYLTCKESER